MCVLRLIEITVNTATEIVILKKGLLYCIIMEPRYGTYIVFAYFLFSYVEMWIMFCVLYYVYLKS